MVLLVVLDKWLRGQVTGRQLRESWGHRGGKKKVFGDGPGAVMPNNSVQ
jgi:hypothetical protein